MRININSIVCCMAIFMLTNVVSAQQYKIRKIDRELSRLHSEMVLADPALRFDSLAPLFKDKLIEHLSNPATFNHSLKGLSEKIRVKTSPDRKIKFYSWDELGGGTWHNIVCVAQFKSASGEVVVQLISSGDEAREGDFTDSYITEIHKLNHDSSATYLTFGWGTHGSSSQHFIMQVFNIVGDSLVSCKNCFPTIDPVIQFPRSEKADLTFNSDSGIISYKEYILVEEQLTYRPTGAILKLKWVNEIFIKE